MPAADAVGMGMNAKIPTARQINNANDNHYQFNLWIGVIFSMSLTSLIQSRSGRTEG